MLVLQSHFLDATPTVIVAPMMREEVRVPYSWSSAPVKFGDLSFYVSVAELVAIHRRRLTRPIGNLLEFDYDIRRALDAVFLGV